MESRSWFRRYAKSVGGWWWAAVLATATLVGGLPGILDFAKGTGMSPLVALLLALLVASVLLNLRQAFVWRNELQSRQAEEKKHASLVASLEGEITSLKCQASELEAEPKSKSISIPEHDQDAIRDVMKAAGRIHNALAGFNIAHLPPHEKAQEELAGLDERSEEVVEYYRLHRLITEYKVCVARLLPRFKKIPLTDSASFEALLEPETAAYQEVVQECRRLLVLNPPADPPPSKSGS